MNVVGYDLSIGSNNTDMFPTCEPSHLFCPTCEFRRKFDDPTQINPDYAFTKSYRPLYLDGKVIVSVRDAITYTYDSCAIASAFMRDFCIERAYDVAFQPFPNDAQHFLMMPLTIVKVNLDRSGVVRKNLCSTCGNYGVCIYHRTLFLDVQSPLPDGFYRTDLILGNGNSKRPCIIIGWETRAIFKEAKIRKIGYRSVFGSSS